jgi:hypothetical protein
MKVHLPTNHHHLSKTVRMDSSIIYISSQQRRQGLQLVLLGKLMYQGSTGHLVAGGLARGVGGSRLWMPLDASVGSSAKKSRFRDALLV